MLFRCVIPTLKLDIFSVDGGGYPSAVLVQRLEERLKEVASVHPVMDYAARFYVNQNTVGELTGRVRDDVLKTAFVFHLRNALEELETKAKNQSRDIQVILQAELKPLKELEKKTDTTVEDVFKWGLATKNGTSSALKYLACF